MIVKYLNAVYLVDIIRFFIDFILIINNFDIEILKINLMP